MEEKKEVKQEFEYIKGLSALLKDKDAVANATSVKSAVKSLEKKIHDKKGGHLNGNDQNRRSA